MSSAEAGRATVSPTPTSGDRRDPASTWVDDILGRARTRFPLCAVVVGIPGSGRSALLNVVHERLREVDIPVSVGMPAGGDTVGPTLVLADDLHTWPGDLVARMATMIDAGTIGLIATTEPRETDPALRAVLDLARRSGAVLELGTMSTADVLVQAARTGLTLTPATASLIRRRCGGARNVVTAALLSIREEAAAAVPGETVDELVIVERVARDRHHRLLRGLDPTTLSVLALASLRAPLDPGSLAETLDVPYEAAVEALDRARGTGLLRGADVFVSAAGDPLRAVVGNRRLDQLRRTSVAVRLRASELTVDDALHAAEAGIEDPRLVDTLLAGAADATAARAVVLLRAADRLEPGRDDVRLLMAQRALVSGDVDGAGEVADLRLESARPTEKGIEHWVGIAALVAAQRGLGSHAADLYRWLGPDNIAAESLSAVTALVAVGDRASAAAVAAADAGRPPVGARAIRSRAVRGLLASVCADHEDGGDAVGLVVRGLTSAVPGGRDPSIGRTLHAATALALNSGDLDAARALRKAAGDSAAGALLDAEIALTSGDLDAVIRLLPTEEPAGAADRLRAHAVRLGHGRRNGDTSALAALWPEAPALLAATEIDLYLLQSLAEFWQAAARLDVTASIDRHISAADRLLESVGNPVTWAAPWHFAGVQAAVIARDAELATERQRLLQGVAGSNETASGLVAAARTWMALTFEPVGSVDDAQVAAAVAALRLRGLTWEASRLAGIAALRTDDPGRSAGLLETARSVDADRRRPRPVDGLLTEREAEVARELLQGFTYREIGARLFISAKTVEHHVSRIRRRLDAGSRSELMAALRAAGYS
ncbi:putative LuxR family transcriptional regulator [Gordonia namibiensis NBRC 108229]|uniref:Putative LuxR family transcriptional regulator n=1 Tax=Gordonia namibiensis NBRC 108229 TaxID=1208314 RepID=K6W009_9ACTN|nr:LuxR family transcriptional regulator [Gordonia namibiensis]GAC01834.1 putative LuxR family transcriptional regulator [Gordonia namibiensis NBRC 108229]